ncbi:MAG: hypothetical protein LBQ09_12105 [Acidobacteriaceae bacterium]|nr:hypothetical protein [Acidobacteriaceae bacterium]
MRDALALVCEAAAKAAVYLAVQVAVGVGTGRWLAHLAFSDSTTAPEGLWFAHRLRRMAWWTALCLLLATALRAIAHTITVFGTPNAAAVWTIAIESRWGHGWQLQIAAAALLIASATALRVQGDQRMTWHIYIASALTCCVSLPLLGHGAGSAWRMALHAAHVAASGVWLGTLAVLAALLPALGRIEVRAPQRVIVRFAVFALPAATLVVATGVIAALDVNEIAQLFNTVYGRTLILKVSLVAMVVAGGAFNWRRSRQGEPPRLGGIVCELGTALLVVIVTAFLTELEHP